MANRYTDIDKWDDDWFLNLSPKMKCAWNYICDNAKGCGEQKLSFTKLSSCVKEQVTREDVDEHFKGRVFWIDHDTIWAPGTTWRIYKTLSPKIPAHINAAKKILRITEGLELSERGQKVRDRFEQFLLLISQSEPEQGLTRPQPGTDIKEKGEERKEDRERGAGKGKDPQAPRFDFETPYRTFLRKEGKEIGMANLRSLIRTHGEYELFCLATKNYTALMKHRKKAVEYTKSWASFVGDGDAQPWRDFVETPWELESASSSDGDPDRAILAQISELSAQGNTCDTCQNAGRVAAFDPTKPHAASVDFLCSCEAGKLFAQLTSAKGLAPWDQVSQARFVRDYVPTESLPVSVAIKKARALAESIVTDSAISTIGDQRR